MQFYGDLLSEILGESAPSSKKLHLKQNATEWSKTIVADARDVYDDVSTEKGGLPQQEALTLEIATIREWLVNSGALTILAGNRRIVYCQLGQMGGAAERLSRFGKKVSRFGS